MWPLEEVKVIKFRTRSMSWNEAASLQAKLLGEEDIIRAFVSSSGEITIIAKANYNSKDLGRKVSEKRVRFEDIVRLAFFNL